MADAVTADLLLGGRYRLLRELARGGMATVWEAEDSVLGRKVAVKVLHPHLAADESFRERFRREAVAVARLSHPAIVAVYDTGQDDDLAYLVMELVEGRTLRDELAERGALEIGRAVEIVAQVAEGLATAHDRRIVHRDVKPGNILVQPDGRAKLTDFGIARAGVGGESGGDLTQVGTVMGTARYVAPEQIEGGNVDARSDVYALGLVLYEALCGRPAFDEETDLATAVARIHRPPLSPRQVRVDVPRDLEQVVMRALALDPAARYATAGELRAALRAVTPDAGRSDTTPEGGIPMPAPDDRRFTAGVLAVVLVAVAVAVGSLFLAGTETGRSVLQRVREGFPGGDPAPAPVAIVAVADFDPFGNDGAENPERTGLAHDGDPSTAWRTDSYHAPRREFGNLKPGVGLRIQLSREASVRRVTVQTLEAGWDADVYVGDGSADDLAGWGEPVGSGRELGTRASIDASGDRGTWVLLWITRLPEGGQLQVAEVGVAA